MDKSKVYFTDFRTGLGTPLTAKLQKLIKLAGIQSIDMDNKFVAIKMHFGELGNLAYLRPNYAKAVADVVKELGGMPLAGGKTFDCANINGFNTVTTGCQIIIADGLRGTDDIIVPVPNGEYCKEAYIGRAVMDADIFISLTHFKGHEQAGFGGCIKNIGMGCGSRAGKMQQHQSGHPHVITERCRGCRRCSKECGSDAFIYENGKARIDPAKCKGCGRCIGACSFDAIENDNWDAASMLGRKMAEYTAAVISGRPSSHISLITDVSPNCDCHGENDAPILPDIGMLASFDPVALDQACVDLCQKAEPVSNSQLGDNMRSAHFHDHGDVWHNSNPNVSWAETLEHGEKIGIGTRDYELVIMK